MHDFELREREDEDAAAQSYELLYHSFPVTKYWDDDFLAYLAPHVSQGDRVLDLGCGPGSMWHHWTALPSLDRLVGVDLSPRMIEEARRAHPAGEFEVARAHELPFDNGDFDVVIASSVLHHIPDQHLPAALEEITRVLDEHGRLVGREPMENTFAQSPGWVSGSMMMFRHLVFRLTRSREFPEPTLGSHHHVFEQPTFCDAVNDHLTLTDVASRFPVSPFLARINDARVARLAKHLDERVRDDHGSMFYFVGEKNYATADDVLVAIRNAREQELPGLSEGEFLAYLDVATREIGQIFGEPVAPSDNAAKWDRTHQGQADRPDS